MKKKIYVTIGLLIVLLIGGSLFYLLDSYAPEQEAIEVFDAQGVISATDDMVTIFSKEESSIGFIFYPGGKVDSKSYAPLLNKLSEHKITVILAQMPFHLAIFNNDAAENIIENMPEITTWYIGGHSLGGAMASSYVAKNPDDFAGIVLLGAYAMEELTIPTLAIYGSEDKILSREKLVTTENQYVINGGNHAFFGNYGEQDGDGKATITRDEQQDITVEQIIEFINSHL